MTQKLPVLFVGHGNPSVRFEKGDQAVVLAINSAEHYAPLLYSLALRDESDSISFFADKVMGGCISMRR